MSYLHLVAQTGERVIAEERGDERASAGDTVDIGFEPHRAMVFAEDTGLRIR